MRKNIHAAPVSCHWLKFGPDKKYCLEKSVNTNGPDRHHFCLKDDTGRIYSEFSITSESDIDGMFTEGLMKAKEEVSWLISGEQRTDTEIQDLNTLLDALKLELNEAYGNKDDNSDKPDDNDCDCYDDEAK